MGDFSRTARLAKETPPRFAPKTPSWPLAPYAAMVSTTRFALLALVAISLLAAPPGCSAARALRQSDDAELAITADAAPEQFSFWSTSIDSVYDKGSNHAAPRLKDHHDALHRTAHGWIEGFVPKSYSPFVATVISYALLVLPFLAAYNLFSAMGHTLSLQKLLMAINIYNATYCALLVVFNLWTGNEPMASLQESNEADYLILQFAKVRVPRLRVDPVRARRSVAQDQGGEYESCGGWKLASEPVHRVPLLPAGVGAGHGGPSAAHVAALLHAVHGVVFGDGVFALRQAGQGRARGGGGRGELDGGRRKQAVLGYRTCSYIRVIVRGV